MSRLTQTRPINRGPGLPCSVARVLEELEATDPDSADDLQAWLDGQLVLDDGRKPSERDMAWMLAKLGKNTGRGMLGRHRRGDCRCGRAVAA